jgi:hypothetical protein
MTKRLLSVAFVDAGALIGALATAWPPWLGGLIGGVRAMLVVGEYWAIRRKREKSR